MEGMEVWRGSEREEQFIKFRNRWIRTVVKFGEERGGKILDTKNEGKNFLHWRRRHTAQGSDGA